MKIKQIYQECESRGYLTKWNGLCSEMYRAEGHIDLNEPDGDSRRYSAIGVLEWFKPVEQDLKTFPESATRSGENVRGYWGSDLSYADTDCDKDFGPLRQTIMIFVAAILGEEI